MLALIPPPKSIAMSRLVPSVLSGPKQRLARGTRLDAHVTLLGDVEIGRGNKISAGAVIGGEPQDVSYKGSETRVVIGDFNVIRECVTINRASEKEDGVTSLGDHCYLMACSHVAHDCKISDRVIIANGTLLGGHVHIANDATLSGASCLHHFVRVGAYSFVSGMSRVIHDVPPYMLVNGVPTRPRCINVVALKRKNFPAEVIKALSETHRLLFRAQVGLANAREILRANSMLFPAVTDVLTFIDDQQQGRNGRGRDRRRAA